MPVATTWNSAVSDVIVLLNATDVDGWPLAGVALYRGISFKIT